MIASILIAALLTAPCVDGQPLDNCELTEDVPWLKLEGPTVFDGPYYCADEPDFIAYSNELRQLRARPENGPFVPVVIAGLSGVVLGVVTTLIITRSIK